ncbi:hypothetical protein AMATHDRAFT_49759 [Amanita thiersii Skay4041]|uniref:Uncharacterized protein n=1 Tax=Amanita thiersii Skay4041 TaxID=703135 RepID=A0A2A9NK61_9AGAR|nr:hypothetical protein AMATHDRAFT_49759 [Amanita thiersii Skay4041]
MTRRKIIGEEKLNHDNQCLGQLDEIHRIDNSFVQPSVHWKSKSRLLTDLNESAVMLSVTQGKSSGLTTETMAISSEVANVDKKGNMASPDDEVSTMACVDRMLLGIPHRNYKDVIEDLDHDVAQTKGL